MGALNENFVLSNGVEIPKIGFGTWQIPNGEVAYNAVADALKIGYRHIDTANAYRNESSVGQAVRESGIERSEIFVTTKLPAEIKSYDEAHETFEKSMSELQLEHVDLYLIHAPWPWDEAGADYRQQNSEVWKAFEEIYNSGRAKSIGVSNFVVADLESLLAMAEITPHANQISYYIGHTQNDTVAFCREQGILVEGYSPLATGAILENPKVAAIAEKYSKSVAQISIRYVLQNDILPLPKSTHQERIKQNAEIDFELSKEDMAYLDSLKDIL